MSRVPHIAIAVPPETVSVPKPSLGVHPQLLAALSELARDLTVAAEQVARFERAAALGADLQAELRRLFGSQVSTAQRSAVRRSRRSARTTARLVKALREESAALEHTCQQVSEYGLFI